MRTPWRCLWRLVLVSWMAAPPGIAQTSKPRLAIEVHAFRPDNSGIPALEQTVTKLLQRAFQPSPVILVSDKEQWRLRLLISEIVESPSRRVIGYSISVTVTRPLGLSSLGDLQDYYVETAEAGDLPSLISRIASRFMTQAPTSPATPHPSVASSEASRPNPELPPPPVIPSSNPTISQYDDLLAALGNTSNSVGGGSGSGEKDGVFKVGGPVTAPALIYKVEPVYSRLAEASRIEGTVLLYAEVDPTGKATNPKVIRGLGYGLDEQAILAIREWKFRPGYKDGKPVTVAATIEVNFRLGSRPSVTAPPSNPFDYPLKVYIVQTQWTATPYGIRGWGVGNIRDGQAYYGFDFNYSCSSPFRETVGSSMYPGKWQKESLRLKILTREIGKVNRTHECELKTSVRNDVYGVRDGHLVVYSQAQLKAGEAAK